MRRTTSSQGQPVSLFPFLAVLICMMGALVLLLLGLTSTMRQRLSRPILASIPTPSAPVGLGEDLVRPPSPPLPGDFDRGALEEARMRRDQERRAHWQGVLESLTEERDRLQRLVEDQKRERARRQTELDELRSRLETHSNQSVSSQASVGMLEERQKQSEQELQSLAKRIALTERNLEELRLRQADSGNAHAILPYDGRSGTVRRPIYIECTEKGYRFLPEDVFVGPNELKGATPRSNALAFGAKALLRYWTLRNVRDPGRNPRPYLLLIVRPGGIFAYDAARQLLSRLETSFGYELVEDEIQLQKLPPDPQAVALLKDAIALATDAGSGGGESEIQRGTPKTESWEELTGKSPSSASSVTRRNLPGSATGDEGADLPGVETRQSSRGESGLEPGVGPGTPNGTGKGKGVAPRTVRDPLPRARAASLGGRPGGSLDPVEHALANPSDDAGRHDDESAPPRRLRAGSGEMPSSEANPTAGRVAAESRSPDTSASGDDGEPDLRSDSAVQGIDSAPASNETGNVGPLPGVIQRGSPALSARPPTESQTEESLPSSDESGLDAPRSLSTTELKRSPPTSSVTSSGSGVRTNERSPIRKPSTEDGLSRHPGEPGTNPHRMGGGVPGGNPRNLIALQRKILIRVEKNQVLVGDEEPITIPVKRNQKADQLITQVTAAMRDVVDSWGPPPARFYWNPAVRFEVTKEGNAVYERLRGAFERQKMTTSADYIDGTDRQPGGRP